MPRVASEPDIYGDKDNELEALQRNAHDLFRDVVSHSPQLSDDLQTVALNIDDPVRSADFIAGTLPSLSTLLRQELLETSDVRKRLETLIRELSKELEVLELRNKIQEQVQEQVSQSQREYLLARTDEGHSEGAGRIRRRASGNRRAAQEGRRSRHDRRSQERVRPRAEAAGKNDAGFGRIHGFAHLSGMDDLAALEQIFRQLGNRHCQGAGNSGRGSLRPGKGERAHPRLSGGEKTAAGNEGTDPVLPRASRRGQNFARKIHCPRAGTQVRAHLARRHARRSGNSRPSPHLHRRASRTDHPGHEPRRNQRPGLHAGRSGQARTRFPRRSVFGADGSARSGAEQLVPRSLSGRAVRSFQGTFHRHGQLDRSDSGTAARPHGDHRTRRLYRRWKRSTSPTNT